MNKAKTVEELGKILAYWYEKAERNEQVTAVHLFGILFLKDINQKDISIREVINAASGVPKTYQTELNKGFKLANYVKLDPDTKTPFKIDGKPINHDTGFPV